MLMVCVPSRELITRISAAMWCIAGNFQVRGMRREDEELKNLKVDAISVAEAENDFTFVRRLSANRARFDDFPLDRRRCNDSPRRSLIWWPSSKRSFTPGALYRGAVRCVAFRRRTLTQRNASGVNEPISSNFAPARCHRLVNSAKQRRPKSDWCRHLANSTKQYSAWFWTCGLVTWKHYVIHKTGSTWRIHCCQKRTETRPQVTCTENFVTSLGIVVLEICQRTHRQTACLYVCMSDKRTDRQTRWLPGSR